MDPAPKFAPLSVGSSLAAAALFVAWVIVLALVHHPPLRVVTVGVLGGLITISNLMAARARNQTVRPWVTIIGMITAAVITGGLRSPLFVAVLGPFFVLPLTLYGRGLLGGAVVLVAGSALAMALLPPDWLGPPIADPAWTVLMLLTVISVVTIASAHSADVQKTLYASRREIDRTHELITHQAFARVSELEQMSAKLSHELKNPLGAIKMLVQLSAREATEAKSRERLKVAEAEIERMGGILKGYLSFARPFDKLRSEPVDLGALADEVLQLLGPAAASGGITLRRSGDARIEADPRRLKEALFNLVANAVQATSRGGSVLIGIARRDGAVEIAVRDSGCGMPPDVLEKVGTPFFTTREKGNGLGVVLARAVFVQHGGALEYTSAEGHGTVATGILPLSRSENGAPAAGG